jgi:hypothetical protein
MISHQNRHALPDLIVPKIRKMVAEKGGDTSSTPGKKETD